MKAIHWVRAGAVTLLIACCGACQPPDREYEEAREPTPREACEDELSAFAQRLEDCGVGSAVEMRVFLEDSLPGQGCASVTAIRDVDELYEECIPSLEALSCGEVLESLPASCAGQLLHDASAPCDDLLTVMAEAFASCGSGDVVGNKQFLESQLPGGSCEAVEVIRDEQELYNICIPTLQEMSCEALMGGFMPESCAGQLQTYTPTTTG